MDPAKAWTKEWNEGIKVIISSGYINESCVVVVLFCVDRKRYLRMEHVTQKEGWIGIISSGPFSKSWKKELNENDNYYQRLIDVDLSRFMFILIFDSCVRNNKKKKESILLSSTMPTKRESISLYMVEVEGYTPWTCLRRSVEYIHKGVWQSIQSILTKLVRKIIPWSSHIARMPEQMDALICRLLDDQEFYQPVNVFMKNGEWRITLTKEYSLLFYACRVDYLCLGGWRTINVRSNWVTTWSSGKTIV